MPGFDNENGGYWIDIDGYRSGVCEEGHPCPECMGSGEHVEDMRFLAIFCWNVWTAVTLAAAAQMAAEPPRALLMGSLPVLQLVAETYEDAELIDAIEHELESHRG